MNKVIPIFLAGILLVSLGVVYAPTGKALTSVSSCSNLNVPGETYVLSNDIVTASTCFTITLIT